MNNEMATYLAPSNTMEAFVAAVKAKLKKDGITQVELAERLQVKPSVVARSLTRKGGNLTFVSADKIASALNTTTIDLLVSRR